MSTRRLVYLYVGSSDVGRDLGFYRDQLGGELVWRSEGLGAEVAAVRLGDGPLVLLADHRGAPSALPIWAVGDLDDELGKLRAAGWAAGARRVEVPDGPCAVLSDPSGNEIALLERVRPGVMEGRGG
ncbi:MAG TPA: VOC family protein [Solirubrobacterales bacterium]|nr:VOC family protein [Solirubrobacterales bacterium]